MRFCPPQIRPRHHDHCQPHIPQSTSLHIRRDQQPTLSAAVETLVSRSACLCILLRPCRPGLCKSPRRPSLPLNGDSKSIAEHHFRPSLDSPAYGQPVPHRQSLGRSDPDLLALGVTRVVPVRLVFLLLSSAVVRKRVAQTHHLHTSHGSPNHTTSMSVTTHISHPNLTPPPPRNPHYRNPA